MSVRSGKESCQATIVCQATKRARRCRNGGSFGGFCRYHAPGSPWFRPTPGVPEARPVVVPSWAPKAGELDLAREVIRQLKAYLRDASLKGRLVNALGDYEDLVGDGLPEAAQARR